MRREEGDRLGPSFPFLPGYLPYLNQLFPTLNSAIMKKSPLSCPHCNTIITTINYEIWGRTKFSFTTDKYEDDKTLGGIEMQLSCPACSSTLELYSRFVLEITGSN
jgi:DNA-directed RNA polymerase subunit RPC12/RpoP